MTKLNDTQLILLSTAAQRDNGSLIPLPDNLAAEADKVRKAITAMIKAGVAEEGEVQDATLAWRADGEINLGARITDVGRTAIGLGETGGAIAGAPETNEPPSVPAKQTKAGLVLELLQREQGATLAELVIATGWLPHTTRAALTGLRKKGHEIEKCKRGDATCYRVAVKA
ncbi:DUF3489 domain-containing protein [Sphingomonas sp. LB-2]|uniref:DUF3489 domain-containing protein n=1 Tax=Sphingomonas caeni TaxID=2984949 RepID=UPI002232009A|nr:DUF3489 domain-containing protein [Sphingomonas caeni]MCW3847382.1 DUF3489 domain-containing protein [Sphingomonas caeni]